MIRSWLSGKLFIVLFLLVQLLAPLPANALLVTGMDDIWFFEVACKHQQVQFFNANGSLLATARSGKLYAANGALEGEIRDCLRIYSSSGALLATRNSDGRYYLANGSLLGRIEPDGRVVNADGSPEGRVNGQYFLGANGSIKVRFKVE